jgi:site-specific recombinase XerD
MNGLITKPDNLPAELLDLIEYGQELIQNSKAERTVNAYRSDFEDFQTFCQDNGLPHLPADVRSVGLYVLHLAKDREYKPSTIERRLVSISQVHKDAGYHEPPSKDPKIRQIIAGLKRTVGSAQHKKKGFNTPQIRQWVGTLGDNVKDIRDRAIILLGYAGAFRRSEIVGLNVDDLQFTDQGYLVTLRKSKTDQEGRGRTIAIPYGEHAGTCPVIALQNWLDKSGITEGAIFRGIFNDGRISDTRLSSKGVARLVKKVCRVVGLDPTDYAGHSLRAGHVTQATSNGAPSHITKQQTGHKSDKVFNGYYRQAVQFEKNSANYLDL